MIPAHDRDEACVSELSDWAKRIDDTAGRIARLLQIDARRFVVDTIRERFVADTHPTDAAQVATLKARAMETADSIGVRLAAAVQAVDYTRLPPPEEGSAPTVTDVEAIREAITSMTARVSALLASVNLPDEVDYPLPQRFIEHESLPSLTRTLFKAIARHAELAAEDEAQQVAQTAAERRQLWESA